MAQPHLPRLLVVTLVFAASASAYEIQEVDTTTTVGFWGDLTPAYVEIVGVDAWAGAFRLPELDVALELPPVVYRDDEAPADVEPVVTVDLVPDVDAWRHSWTARALRRV